jgi:hypothetical protein
VGGLGGTDGGAPGDAVAPPLALPMSSPGGGTVLESKRASPSAAPQPMVSARVIIPAPTNLQRRFIQYRLARHRKSNPYHNAKSPSLDTFPHVRRILHSNWLSIGQSTFGFGTAIETSCTTRPRSPAMLQRARVQRSSQ